MTSHTLLDVQSPNMCSVPPKPTIGISFIISLRWAIVSSGAIIGRPRYRWQCPVANEVVVATLLAHDCPPPVRLLLISFMALCSTSKYFY